jgi:putative transposase
MMPRKSRVVAIGVPHHVTQRGTDRQNVFWHERDRRAYLETLFEYAGRYDLEVWAYCLMTNHVHFIAVPRREISLARVFGRTHSDYARYANVLRRGCGHLWQARFYSCPLDEPATWRAMAYVERNPVRAGLAETADQYPWSSAKAHCQGWDPESRLAMAQWSSRYSGERWREVLRTSVGEEAFQERLRQATGVGLPLGSDEFIVQLGRTLDRNLQSRPPGRPRKRPLAAAAGISENV